MSDTTSTLTIRRLREEDAAAVARLADLDSGALPAGPLLGAEVEGRLLAAVSLRSGALVADPFSRTDQLRALLELRAAQLHERGPRPRGHMPRRPAADSSRDGRRLLSLHPRPS